MTYDNNSLYPSNRVKCPHCNIIINSEKFNISPMIRNKTMMFTFITYILKPILQLARPKRQAIDIKVKQIWKTGRKLPLPSFHESLHKNTQRIYENLRELQNVFSKITSPVYKIQS